MSKDKEIDALIIRNAPGNEKDFIQRMIGKGSTRGLGIRIRQRRSVWIFVFKLNGRQNVMQLGEYPQLSRPDAEVMAIRLRQQVNEGADPRLIAKIEGGRPAIYRDDKVTLEKLVDAWLTRKADQVRDVIRGQFERYIFPDAGALPADAITAPHWLALLDAAHKAAPTVAAKILLYLRAAFKYGRATRLVSSRELDDITPALLGMKPVARDRVLTTDELRDVLRFTLDRNAPEYDRDIVRLMLMFGCRTQEARLSTPDEWDLAAGLWVVPAEHSKNGIEIMRPITDAARPFVVELLRKAALSGSGLLMGKTAVQSRVAHRIGELSKTLGHNHWTAHDLRRTMRTRLADLDVMPFVAESLLGHVVPGIEGVYNRSTMLKQKSEALEKWHKEVARIERAGLLKTVKEASQ